MKLINLNIKNWRFFLVYFFLSISFSLLFLILIIPKEERALTIKIYSDAKSWQLFYDSGNGFSESESQKFINSLSLPPISIKNIRIDPYAIDTINVVSMKKIEISKKNGYHQIISGKNLTQFLNPLNHISSISFDPISNTTKIEIIGNDPYMMLNLDYYSKLKYSKLTTLLENIHLKHIMVFLILLSAFLVCWIQRKSIYHLFVKINSFIDGSSEDEVTQSNKKERSLFSKIIDPFPSMKSFWFLFMISSLIYLFLYSSSYSYLITWANYDDALYFKLANNIANFQWLGDYDSLTLVKYPGYAVFLAFCMATGIPYILYISVCHTIAIAFFLRCSMWIFSKAKLLQFILGIILLYNPIFASALGIYRNQLASICFVVLLGVLSAMFNPNTKRKSGMIKIIEAIIAFTGFGFLFYTREESILYYEILAISIISFLLVKRKIKYIRRNLFLLVTGVLGILFFGITISTINYIYYGRFIICERTSSPYSSFVHTFHSVDDPDLDPRFPKLSASKEKILKITASVPEFEKVSSIMCDPENYAFRDCSSYFDKKELTFKKLDKNCIPTSHFDWFLINSVDRAGYHTSAKKAASFYSEINNKILTALHSGSLKKREVLFSFGPYSMGKDDLKSILRILTKNYFELLQTPRDFIKRVKHFSVKAVSPLNKLETLTKWKNALHVRYLHPDDKSHINQANNSINNSFWNFCVILFAYFGIPLMYLTLPLSLFTFIFAIIRNRWIYAILVLLLSLSYISNLLILSIIDVVVGYDASAPSYFLPSYAAIFTSVFISIGIIISLSKKEKNAIISIQSLK
jgi:hypothetical protein